MSQRQIIKTLDHPVLTNLWPGEDRCLYIEGDIEILYASLLGVVGARDIQIGNIEWMEHELFHFLRTTGWGTISGGARGVDQRAHWLAIRAQCPTVIVLPSGLNKKYPKSVGGFEGHKKVLFISEYDWNQDVRKFHFYNRNRLIAQLSKALLVVQAHLKSGTMISAKHGIEIGRDVLVVPGHPLDGTMSGNNQLLFDGAQIIRTAEDLMCLERL